MTETIQIEQVGAIVRITLNRPKVYNAFDLPMIATLVQHLTKIAKEDCVRGVVITGAGNAFCAGGDLRWATQDPDRVPMAFHQLASAYHQAVLEIQRMEKPVIAAINGMAAGGGFSLALACDFRIMDQGAVLQQAYTSSGLCIDGGGTYNLPRLVGLARALEIAAFDEPIAADQALLWGLVTRLAEPANAPDDAMSMLHVLMQRSVHSFALSKRLLHESFNTAFETQLEREREGLVSCGKHPEGIEGVNAFLEKRKPNFNLDNKA